MTMSFSLSLPRLRFAAPPWRTALAQMVSQVGSPPLLSIAGAGVCAAALDTPAAWGWAALYSLLAFVAPTLYVVWLLRRGEVEDLHLNDRRQRLRPLRVALATGGAALVLLGWGEAPALLALLAALNLVQGALFLAITCKWKISAHCTAAAGLAALGLGLWGGGALPLVLGIPLVAWARLHLERHTPGQVVAGIGLGAGLGFLTLCL
jgi:membrane-associated phospholipid phosphatase